MKIISLLFFLSVTVISRMPACPTCVGKIQPESPAFFSDEFYKPTQSHAISRESKEQFGRQELKKLFDSKRGKK